MDLDKLREKAQAATPGPWHHYRDKLRPQFSGRVNEVQAATRPAVVRWSGFDDSARPEKQHAANAAYIAAADPTTILALIDRLQRVETALRQLINDHLDTCDDTCEAAEIARAALEGGSDDQ